jgi:hypothetical protein
MYLSGSRISQGGAVFPFGIIVLYALLLGCGNQNDQFGHKLMISPDRYALNFAWGEPCGGSLPYSVLLFEHSNSPNGKFKYFIS